jgi:hypothetical protein
MLSTESQDEAEIPAGIRGRQLGRLKPTTHRHPTSFSIHNQQLRGALSDRVPPPPRPGQPRRSSAEPAKRTYTSRDILVGAGALVVLAGVICGVSSGGLPESKPAAETAPALVPLALRASPTPAQQKFVDQAAAWFDFAEPQRARVLKIGNNVCGMLSTGSTVDYIVSTITETGSGLSPADGNKLVNVAAQDLCPGTIPLPSPTS